MLCFSQCSSFNNFILNLNKCFKGLAFSEADLSTVLSNSGIVTSLFPIFGYHEFSSYFGSFMLVLSNGQYLYRNVQFSKASLNGVLFLKSIFEEGGNRSAQRKPSKSG